jgi:hypothetical protein
MQGPPWCVRQDIAPAVKYTHWPCCSLTWSCRAFTKDTFKQLADAVDAEYRTKVGVGVV